jgi:hypothetical protein
LHPTKKPGKNPRTTRPTPYAPPEKGNAEVISLLQPNKNNE